MGGEADLREASILVVHDDEHAATTLRQVLGAAGYTRVALLREPSKAADGFGSFRPDVVFVHVADVDTATRAIESLRQAMHASGAPVPVIAFDATKAEGSARKLLRAGAVDVVTVPGDPHEVVLRLANHLDVQRFGSELLRENLKLRAQVAELRTEEAIDWEERKLVTTRVNEVLNGKHLSMAFQPIFDLQSGKTVGAEALARFSCTPVRSPAEWFAAAAAHGMALQLELAAISASLDALAELPSDVYLSFNVSPEVAVSPAFARALQDAPLHRLVIELTETERVDDYRPLVEALRPLRFGGARVAIDDPGSGFAGLERIVRLEPDLVKLDRSLIDGVDHDPARRALIAALVLFADEIGAQLVAAGIETAAEFDLLRELQVATGQGYFLARPAPLPLARATGEEYNPVELQPVASTAAARRSSPFTRPQTSRLAGALRPVEPEPEEAPVVPRRVTATTTSLSLELARARANARVASR